MGLRDLHAAATTYTPDQWAAIEREAASREAQGLNVYLVNLLPQFRGQWAKQVTVIELQGWRLEALAPADGYTLATFRKAVVD